MQETGIRVVNICYFAKKSNGRPVAINIDEIDAFEDNAIHLKSGLQIEVTSPTEEILQALINTYAKQRKGEYER